MKKNPGLIFLFFLAVLIPFRTVLAQTRNSASSRNNAASDSIVPGGHRGSITALMVDEKGRIISSGMDGFIEIWNQEKNTAEERFQISNYSIISMALRPGHPQLAFVENNSAGFSRISVWDYEKKTELFTLPFGDNINNIYYSGSGSFLMITGNAGVSLINSDTGASMTAPRELTGSVTFAATGRSERSMVSYLDAGYLSYWDLESGNRIQNFSVPREIKSPVLLGNNRFLAGFDSQGLLILDAVNGTVIQRDINIRNGILFTGNPEGLEFVCLIPGNVPVIYHLNISNPSKIALVNRRNIPTNIPQISCGAVLARDRAVLGTADGRILIFNQNGTARYMETQNQIRIEDAALSSDYLAFRTEDSKLVYIPADYRRLYSNFGISAEDSGPYGSISADPRGNSLFLVWQQENIRSFPLSKQIVGVGDRLMISEAWFDKLSLRFPLRSVSIYRNLFLFLDTVGNIWVINQDTGDIVFTFYASGSQDIAFVNEQNILIGRSTGNAAFLMVNIATGETVPLPLSTAIGVKLYRGVSGFVYGGAISRIGNNFRTSLVAINTANPPLRTVSVAEYDGEDMQFGMAESGSYLATTLGSQTRIYRISGFNGTPAGSYVSMQRQGGLPLLILGSGSHFLIIDTDGSIIWHDPASGKILAIFRLYNDGWVLEKDGSIIRGGIQKN